MKQNEFEKTRAMLEAENIIPPLEGGTVPLSSLLIYVLNGAGILALSVLIFMALSAGGWAGLVLFIAVPTIPVCILSLLAGAAKRKKTRLAALIINAILLLILLVPLRGCSVIIEAFSSGYFMSDRMFLCSIAFIPLVVNLFLLVCLESAVSRREGLAAAQKPHRQARRKGFGRY
jgi:hypothetical protein